MAAVAAAASMDFSLELLGEAVADLVALDGPDADAQGDVAKRPVDLAVLEHQVVADGVLEIEVGEIAALGQRLGQDLAAEGVGDAELPLEVAGGLGPGKAYQPLDRIAGTAIVAAAAVAPVFRKERLLIFVMNPSSKKFV